MIVGEGNAPRPGPTALDTPHLPDPSLPKPETAARISATGISQTRPLPPSQSSCFFAVSFYATLCGAALVYQGRTDSEKTRGGKRKKGLPALGMARVLLWRGGGAGRLRTGLSFLAGVSPFYQGATLSPAKGDGGLEPGLCFMF